MSTKKIENDQNIKAYKQSLSVPQLIGALVFGTYFLTVQTIELSLSMYVLQENKIEVYREYLLFKRQAPLWKQWQLFSTVIVLLSIITAVRNFLETFTKKATFKRNVLDVIKIFQLFIVLYTIITRMLPLENELIQSTSKNNIQQINSTQWFVVSLNILGWFIPLFQYLDGKNNKHIHPNKKTQ